MITDEDIIVEDEEIIETPMFTRDVKPCPEHMRHYQQDAYYSIGKGWKLPGVRRQLVIMATGTGKTIVMGAVAEEEVSAGGRVMMLAHTDELLDQAMDKFITASGLKASKEKAAERSSRHDKVVVASVQTMCRQARLDEFPPDTFTLIMIDETHRCLSPSYQKVLKHFTGARALGVTATADRGDKKELGTFFDRIAIDYDLRKAVRDGWLVRPVVKTVPIKIDVNAVKTRGGDLAMEEVAHAIEPFLVQIAEEIRIQVGHLKTVIFMPNIDTAKKIAAALQHVGENASYVSGECPDRKQKIAAFEKAGPGSEIANAMLLTEGWDVADLSCVIPLRLTKIRSLLCQMIGRGTRPHPSIVRLLNACSSAEGRVKIIRQSPKPRLMILDFLWVCEKHQLCRPASLISRNPEQAKRMTAMGDGDLLEQADRAEADATEKLRKEIEKNKHKTGKLIDPLEAAAELHDPDLADYEPETVRDAMPPTKTQMAVLQKEGLNPATIGSYGQAEKLIETVMVREEKGLSSLRQLHFLAKLKIDASNLTYENAQALIKKKIGGWHHGGRRR